MMAIRVLLIFVVGISHFKSQKGQKLAVLI